MSLSINLTILIAKGLLGARLMLLPLPVRVSYMFFLLNVSVAASVSAGPTASAAFDKGGVYTISVNSKPWYQSPAVQTLCVAGKQTKLNFKGGQNASGSDKFGAWTGIAATYSSTSPVL